MIAFVCHPYHRGGVTSWMKDVFLEAFRQDPSSVFITVKPNKTFISGGNRPNMVSFIDSPKHVYYKTVGLDFELGTLDRRVSVYRRLIMKYVSPGATLVPSDDEACWKACCQMSHLFKVIGVLHSDDQAYYDIYRKYSRFLSGAVSVSNRIKNHVADVNDSIPHVVIPCGIPIEEFKVGSKNQNIISWIGRIEEEQKRVTDIPKIARALKNQSENWEMNIYGDGGQLQELRSETITHKLEDNLFFHGWTASNILKDKLKDSKVLLQTSNYEGMSVAVMEALASGCKIVSSEVSGVEDLVADPMSNGVVFLYPVGDIDQAKKQLAFALEDDLSEHAIHARKLAEKNYSIVSCLNAYRDFGNGLKTNPNPYPISIAMKMNSQISTPLAKVRYLKYKLLRK
ncbi:glycosyltransferase family 4 protein [Rhodonellum sp.]|uniref:glycosyltransferase family 4 protein n=1 Tax=Rhodonellum sp. TaxID=2231180 RepID=UPI002728C0F7|nr:glycosyltransferase family 4 protein [Rhodonellum sp.]MDO9551458.1 glycosyltransferase family 4 protein [Rhodonellum sp.]